MRGNRFFRSAVFTVAALLFSFFLFSGCGSSGNSNEATAQEAPAYDAAPEAGGGAVEGESAYSEDAATGAGGPTITQPQDERKIVLTADIAMETLDFDKTCEDLQASIQSFGGYIAATDMQTDTMQYTARSAYFTVKIPAANYADFIQSLDNAGTVLSRYETSEDVTSQYVDIESRLRALRAQEERLFALMEDANNMKDLLTIQEQLTEVQYEIENYTTAKNQLEQLVSYSTVDIHITEVTTYTEPAPETYGSRMSRAFRESWMQALYFLQTLSIGLVSILPALLILAILAVIVLVIVLLVRRKRKKNPPAYTPPPVPPGQGYVAPPQPDENTDNTKNTPGPSSN